MFRSDIQIPISRGALLSHRSEQEASPHASDLFPEETEIRELLEMTARFYGNLIGVKYSEPYAGNEPAAKEFLDPLIPKATVAQVHNSMSLS